jgi:integrase
MAIYKRCGCGKAEWKHCSHDYHYEIEYRGNRQRQSTKTANCDEAKTVENAAKVALYRAVQKGIGSIAPVVPGQVTISSLLLLDEQETRSKGGRNGAGVSKGNLRGLQYAHSAIEDYLAVKYGMECKKVSPAVINCGFVVDYINFRRQQDISPNTIGRELQVMKRLVIAASEQGVMSLLPRWPKLGKGEPDEKLRGRSVPVDVLYEFLELLAPDVRALYGVAAYTGWRRGTLEKITLEMFRETTSGVFAQLPAGVMKGRKAEYLPVPPEAWEIIRVRGPGLIFPPRNNLRRTIVGAVRRLNISRQARGLTPYDDDTITLRDIRTTYENMLLESGADPTTIQALMGHKDLRTTAIYQRARLERLTETASTIGKALPGRLFPTQPVFVPTVISANFPISSEDN